jgi:hypothetical protein
MQAVSPLVQQFQPRISERDAKIEAQAARITALERVCRQRGVPLPPAGAAVALVAAPRTPAVRRTIITGGNSDADMSLRELAGAGVHGAFGGGDADDAGTVAPAQPRCASSDAEKRALQRENAECASLACNFNHTLCSCGSQGPAFVRHRCAAPFCQSNVSAGNPQNLCAGSRSGSRRSRPACPRARRRRQPARPQCSSACSASATS